MGLKSSLVIIKQNIRKFALKLNIRTVRWGTLRHLGFYQELEIRLKPREMVIFCTLHEK